MARVKNFELRQLFEMFIDDAREVAEQLCAVTWVYEAPGFKGLIGFSDRCIGGSEIGKGDILDGGRGGRVNNGKCAHNK